MYKVSRNQVVVCVIELNGRESHRVQEMRNVYTRENGTCFVRVNGKQYPTKAGKPYDRYGHITAQWPEYRLNYVGPQ